MKQDEWWIRVDGMIVGPKSGPEIRQLVKQKKILPNTMLSPDQKRWLPANKIPGLFGAPSVEVPRPPTPDKTWQAKSGPAGSSSSARAKQQAPEQAASYDAFLSYSSKDQTMVNAICATLERDKVRCWVAYRDILPGRNYGEAIIDGINSSRVLVVVLSAASNGSPQVLREVERAVNKGIPIIPFRIENIKPTKSMEFFLSAPHWLDALTPPVEAHISRLAVVVRKVLEPASASTFAPPDTNPKPFANWRPFAESLGQNRLLRRVMIWGGVSVINIAMIAALVMIIAMFRPNTLNAEYSEYRKQISSGRGSVVFLQKVAPGRYSYWRGEAEAGNPIAQLFVGRCYQEGLVVGRDEAAAIPWFEKSAAKGNNFAMHTLGMAYEDGLGVPADPAKALQWYTKAGEAGNMVSMRALGLLYAGSLIAKPNHDLALKWYRQAANAGDAVSMRFLGNCYKNGTNGVTPDQAEAENWYKKAAAAGDAYTIGIVLGNKLAPHFADYLAKDAADNIKARALTSLHNLQKEYDKNGLLEIGAIFDASDLRIATTTMDDLSEEDDLRAFYDGMVEKYISKYASASLSEREHGVETFSMATNSRVEKWYKKNKFDEIAVFWERAYKGISFAKLKPSQELNNLVRQMNWSAASLLRTGQRKEAEAIVQSALELCDRSLKERPWDWYTKDAYFGLCFGVADAWVEIGEPGRAQSLLRLGWGIVLRQYGREELLEKYKELPQKGKVPAGATAEDREFFKKFGPNADKSKSGLKRFTIPCDFSGKKYPFHVYVLSGPRGYAELQDQFRWLKDFRGGEVPTDVRDSFLRLNKIAVENNVDFMELCVYALGTAKEDDGKKEKNKAAENNNKK